MRVIRVIRVIRVVRACPRQPEKYQLYFMATATAAEPSQGPLRRSVGGLRRARAPLGRSPILEAPAPPLRQRKHLTHSGALKLLATAQIVDADVRTLFRPNDLFLYSAPPPLICYTALNVKDSGLNYCYYYSQDSRR